MEGGQQEAPVGRRHYRVRHRRRVDGRRRLEQRRPLEQRPPLERRPPLEQHRRAADTLRPRTPRQEPQAVLEWAALKRVRPLPLAALVLRWLLIAVLCLAVLDVARAAGVPIVLIVLVWAWSAAVRGRRRASYRGPERPRPAAPPTAASGPPRGNPYDLETYLRRLREDGR
jgi:hypothetical protein